MSEKPLADDSVDNPYKPPMYASRAGPARSNELLKWQILGYGTIALTYLSIAVALLLGWLLS